MARIAVISDVHANLDALVAVLDQIDGLETYCLGDLVDYGAEPNEVIELLNNRGVICILGNHDSAALTGDTSLFNPRAAMSSAWTRRQLTGPSMKFLRKLPLSLRVKLGEVDVFFTHGSPDDMLWEYVDPRTHSDLFGHYLDRTKTGLMGLGHTHVPYVWTDGKRVVFNPGSVGQPRDGDWRASWAVVSVNGSHAGVEIRRVEYEAARAAEKIRNAGLPEIFAERLRTGD